MFKTIVVCMALLIGSVASGSTLKCTVVGVDGAILPDGTHNQVILECDVIDGIEIGQKVKVKLPKKVKATIEGC